MTAPTDRLIRVMTDDGAFRVLAVRSTDTVRAIAAAQQVTGAVALRLGEVVTASVLVRETMAPGNRVQVLYTDPIGSRLVGDAQPDGNTRGLAQVLDDVLGVYTGAGGTLQVVRIVRAGMPHQGFVETTDQDTVATALQTYFLQSEQVQSMLAIACAERADGQLVAGGFVVQLLPEVTDPPLIRMRARCDALTDFGERMAASDADPDAMLEELLDGMPFTLLAQSPVQFHCGCGPDRATAAAATLGKDEVRQLLETGEELSITCDYCRTRYTVGADAYRRILEG